MRKLPVLLFCLIAIVSASAKQISEQEALVKAQQFMQGKQFSQTGRRFVKGKQVGMSFKNIYVFNAESNGGFVIVSGDDRTRSILGYAAQGEINYEKMPCSMRWLLDYYDLAIAQLGDDVETTGSSNVTRSSNGRSEIATIIDTQWGQGEPYNTLCPLYEGSRCITGCVATAMAQVINYHRWPQAHTANIPSYTTLTHGINMMELPAKQFDWNNMSSTSIAQLMLYCGQSVQMDYDPGASGAYSSNVPTALVNMFGYSKSTSLVGRGSYSDDQWNQMVYDELLQGRPVLYFGQSPDAGGHAFIVDGYADDMYHLNWGWDGYCDGYFTLDKLNPNMNNGFNYSQEMVINACPPADAGDISRPKAIVTSITCSERYLERTSSDAAFPAFTVTSTVESDLTTEATLQIGLALFDDNGMVEVLTQDSHAFTPTDSYTSEAQITIQGDLPQGEYRIMTINRGSDTEEWLTNLGGTTRYVAISIGETSMQLQPMPKIVDDQKEIEFGVHTIDGITYKLRSQYDNLRATILPYNETEKYTGDIYIPDNVNYQNMVFSVSGTQNEPFENCPELTSISTPIRLDIRWCAKLSKLEMRETVSGFGAIADCPSLESITYPSLWGYINAPARCESLRYISFKNTSKIVLECWDGGWTKEEMPALKDIYFAGDIPPVFSEYSAPLSVNEDIKIHIPQGTIEVYKRSDWKDWNLVEDQQSIPISVKWDYCGSDPQGNGGGYAVGNGDDDVEFAMRIPAEHITAYKDCKITAIEYHTDAPSINDYHWEDVEYVFITKRGTDYLTKQAVKTIRGTWMRVELSQPYTITGDELFVGIGRHSVLSVSCANNDVVEDGMWGRVMGNDYGGYYPGEWYKNWGAGWKNAFRIRAVIQGEKLPTDVVIVGSDMEEDENREEVKEKGIAKIASDTKDKTDIYDNSGYFCYTRDENGSYHTSQSAASATEAPKKVVSTNKRMRLKLCNRTPRLVKQVTLNWDIDGKKQEPYIVETVMLTNHEDIVYVNLPDNIGGRNHTISFDVSEVDGEPDEIPANSSAEINFSTPSTTYFPRKIVMEEATGTWCGWCPRGMVAINYMNEHYPDDFIAIAIHDDEMQPTDEYIEPFYSMVNSVPSSLINRSYWLDPWPFNIDEIKNSGEAMIEANAEFTPDGKVEINTKTIFGFNDNGSTEYRIAYVVVEDSVGPYYQNNFYSDPNAADNPDDLMNWWVHQGPYVETIYNDVARAIYDYDGIADLLPKEIKEGETYECKYTVPLPNNIQNVENLKIVALLLDSRTGEILNADRTAISGDFVVAIKDVVNESNSFDVYNLAGIKVRTKAANLNGLPKGVYVVNGKKVTVK